MPLSASVIEALILFRRNASSDDGKGHMLLLQVLEQCLVLNGHEKKKHQLHGFFSAKAPQFKIACI